MRHLIPISGKDSLAAAMIQTARHPDLPYEFFFNDTECELPETYDWLERVERKTGWTLTRIGKSLESIIREEDMLPSNQIRFCTRRAKIEPMEKHYGKSGITVYYGLRADENRVGARPSEGWTHSYPLVDAGIDLNGVWLILKNQDLLPPSFFWPSLYYRVKELLWFGDHYCDELPEWKFRQLFSGRTRANCFFCFYQRQYEILWLAETHPDLLWRTSWLERTTGTRRRAAYSFRQGYFFDEIVNRRKQILDRRAREVALQVQEWFTVNLWGETGDTEIALTSCGLLCGK